MNYRELQPSGFLTHFIACFWEYRTADLPLKHTIIPDGYFDLIVEFEDDQLQLVKLTGVWTEPVNVSIPQSTTLFGIRFKLLATEYLFQQEIKSVLNTSKELPLNFWNCNTYRVNDFEKFVADISGRLEHSIQHLNEIDSRKLRLFDLIYTQKTFTVAEISESVFWSNRQINRYFTRQFGFPLKTLLSIVRCHASYKAISEGDLAPNDHYFDQAHFIKEIKKHTGTTPGVLSQNENVRFLQLATPTEK